MIGPRHSMSSHIFILLGLVRSLSADTNPSPLETMADVTNDFGICVLQLIASPHVNTVFSPYGLMSMALLVYEGTRGQAAAEIYNSLHLPWHRDIVRIGFRDLHRYLKSYFSSEGFLKGLVLSKPNVTLRESYIEVLRFYGFQSDNTITQPVFTTQASVGNREDVNETSTVGIETTTIPVVNEVTTMSNETTTMSNQTSTSLPTTTLQVETTQITTTRPQTTKPEESETTVPTTLGTTTDVLTGTNKPLMQPDVLSMQGPEETTLSPTTTTILTTIITTKKEMLATESAESEQTTLEPTTETLVKTTKVEEPSTKEAEITTSTEKITRTQSSSSIETTVTQETKTESSTLEMEMVTMTNPTTSKLESMNMMMDMTNKTQVFENKKPEDKSVSTINPEKETEINGGKTTITEFITTVTNEIPTNEIFTESTGTETVTVFVDTTLPVEAVTFLTTPVDSEMFTDKNSPMFEAIVLMEQNTPNLQNLDLTTYSSLTKRSTESNSINEVLPEQTKPSNTMYSALHKNKTQLSDVPNNENQSWSIGDKEQLLVNSVLSNFINGGNTVNLSDNGLDSTESINNSTEFEEALGFPTLEPDTIIFPTITESRLPRAVKYDEAPQSAALGNWVGSSGWHPSPTDQWFWTFTGDKLVPVLTYTAFLPYADLPALGATALQLPLDDERYSLIVLLPRQSRGLKQLLHSLQWCPLRSILKQFKPTPVYAVVPTFTIVKHINLTPALHKLGVRKIFDGFQANLCEMSDEPNLYVRSVEQVITISIQKYFTNQNWLQASPSQVEQHFLATHPFAYFVVDVETKVALVAGTVVDPLNRNS